jgi:hypothetical protein
MPGDEGVAQGHGHDQDEQRRHDEQRDQAVPVAQQGDAFLEPEGEEAGHHRSPAASVGSGS